MTAPSPPRSLSVRHAIFGIALASTSGAAVLAHAFGVLPLVFAVPFIVLPSMTVLAGIALARRGRMARLARFAELLLRGAAGGLLATLAYDAVRPMLVRAFGLTFEPYRAIYIFGTLITGLPRTALLAQVAGWLYHFCNGISFGMMFALMRPKGGIGYGIAWAMTLQGLMMIAYPAFLQARLDDVGFLLTGIVGHGFWGVVLGWYLRREATRA